MGGRGNKATLNGQQAAVRKQKDLDIKAGACGGGKTPWVCLYRMMLKTVEPNIKAGACVGEENSWVYLYRMILKTVYCHTSFV